MQTKVRKAVIPAAGLGTRFLPATKVVAKELLPIVDRPTVQYIMEELAAAGVEEFILVISKGKEGMLNHFRTHDQLDETLKAKQKLDLLEQIQLPEKLGKVTAVYQDQPRGLGHAVLCAKEAVGNEPFLVALGDDMIDASPSCAEQMVEHFSQHGLPMVAVLDVPKEEVNKYGVVSPKFSRSDTNGFLDKDQRLFYLKDLVEKPDPREAPSSYAIVGRYLLVPEIFSVLEKTGKGAGGEIQLTDALKTYNQEKDLLAYEFVGKRFDAGDKFGYLQANIHYGLRHNETSKKLKHYLKGLNTDA